MRTLVARDRAAFVWRMSSFKATFAECRKSRMFASIPARTAASRLQTGSGACEMEPLGTGSGSGSAGFDSATLVTRGRSATGSSSYAFISAQAIESISVERATGSSFC